MLKEKVMFFSRVSRQVLERTMWKKGIQDVLVRSVMSLMREQIQESEWILCCQRSLRLKWECTMDLCCHLFFFAVVVDVVSELSILGVLSEVQYADDLVLMSETIESLRNNFIKWKEAFESKGLKVNLGETKVMVSGSITKDRLSKSNVDPCGFCSFRVKAN